MFEYEKNQQLSAYANSYLESMCNLQIMSESFESRQTGIVCTIGPVSRDVEKLIQLMKAGMTIARMNFSHGTHDYHRETINNVRVAAARFGRPIAIALDTKGPEIRTGILKGGVNTEVILTANSRVKIHTDNSMMEKCDESNIWLDYKNITKVVNIGDCIYVDDGIMTLRVEKKDNTTLDCTVVGPGSLGSKKGCNLPGVDVDLPAVSKKDIEDLKFGLEMDVDMVFASFIRDKGGVKAIKDILGEKGQHIMIIPKIENQQGIKNFDDILDVSDGIMVARGDLGIEIPIYKVFMAQKMMISKCMLKRKPSICATQMLESMVSKPRPTRAECSDVANAVLDGADCVMLSGETAKGIYPAETVEIMSKICCEAETASYYRRFKEELTSLHLKSGPVSPAIAAAVSCVNAADSIDAKLIIVMTTSGQSATFISSLRPRCSIIAVTRNARTARQLLLYKGILPLHYQNERANEWLNDVDGRVVWSMKWAIDNKLSKKGDYVIIVTGWKKGSGATNTCRIVQVPQDFSTFHLVSQ
ncbi:hypothetical protein A3Q56_00247 [Intoshia linei]|uniref:Pyruvate kinase n=1 Tax=Intoshia linei TaxID=1819745 RepID=A0A177BCE7_9BILA|nr:hypothetical protein A3Q56_00247 [Intoshia linei]